MSVRLGRRVIQHRAAEAAEGSGGEALQPSAPFTHRTRTPTRRQAVTQPAPPTPPSALLGCTQTPRQAGRHGSGSALPQLARSSHTSVPGHLNRAVTLPGRRNANAHTSLASRPLLTVCARALSPTSCVTQHPETRQTLGAPNHERIPDGGAGTVRRRGSELEGRGQ